MVQLFLVKKLITFVTGCTLCQLLVAAITDSPIKKNRFIKQNSSFLYIIMTYLSVDPIGLDILFHNSPTILDTY